MDAPEPFTKYVIGLSFNRVLATYDGEYEEWHQMDEEDFNAVFENLSVDVASRVYSELVNYISDYFEGD